MFDLGDGYQRVGLAISLAALALFWVGLLMVPVAYFWYWAVPLIAFWMRVNWVIAKKTGY